MLPAVASCIAATGDTLAALRAGEMAATRVTPIPTTSERMTVLAVRTRLPAGRPNPNAPTSAFRPAASRTPAASPITAAMRPTAAASMSTEPRTWRLLAPRARNRPFSRVRWATVMAKVFKMMKAPTSRATTAKMRKNLLKTDRFFWTVSCVSLMAAAPVTASVPGGSTRCRLAASCCCDTPGAATKLMEVNLPGAATSRCAAGVVNCTTDVPARVSAVPKPAIPAMRTRCGGPFTSTVVVSPTARWPTVALCLSITT